jgi:hypothetical protein
MVKNVTFFAPAGVASPLDPPFLLLLHVRLSCGLVRRHCEWVPNCCADAIGEYIMLIKRHVAEQRRVLAARAATSSCMCTCRSMVLALVNIRLFLPHEKSTLSLIGLHTPSKKIMHHATHTHLDLKIQYLSCESGLDRTLYNQIHTYHTSYISFSVVAKSINGRDVACCDLYHHFYRTLPH